MFDDDDHREFYSKVFLAGIVLIVIIYAVAGVMFIPGKIEETKRVQTTKSEQQGGGVRTSPMSLGEDTMRYKQTPLKKVGVVIPRHTTFDTRMRNGTQENNTAEKLGLQDAKNAVAGMIDAATDVIESGKSNVVRVKASMDRKDYFVASDLPDKGKAANKLAEVNRRAQYLLQALDEQMDGGRRIKSGDGVDITDSIRRIVKKHYGKIVPFAEYHHPGDLVVGSNSGKGMAIETCLRGKKNPKQWAPDNTMFRVHTHELAHSGDSEYREDGEEAHGPVFKRIHQYLLTVSENLGLYSCAEYKNSGKAFCGVTLSEDYCGGGGGPE